MGDVEIKVSYDDAVADRARTTLDEGDAKDLRIWFAEVRVHPGEALPLNGRGLIVRRRAGAKNDVTLKLRGPDGCLDTVVWADRVAELGHDEEAELEGDWAGPRHLVSASLTRDLDDAEDPDDIADVEKTLSDVQRALVREWLVPLGSAALLGPVEARRWKRDIGVGCTVEFWRARDLRLLEVSTRVRREDAPETQEALTAALAALGLPPDTTAATKTEAVLRALM